MKNLFFISFLIIGLGLQAQTALYNSGNIRIHAEGELGFHTNLINDGAFDQNVGLAGFYGNVPINVSGAFMPIFYDTEIFNSNGVFLNVSLASINTTNFVDGDVITPRSQRDVFYNFIDNAFPVNQGDFSKVNGYAAITNQQSFAFPVGDQTMLRPLVMNSEAVNTLAKAAYFLEDPNFPSSFNTSFNTTRTTRDVDVVSTKEFWDIEGSVPTTITISWNPRSDFAALTDAVYKMGIVGWSKAGNIWVDLGNVDLVGDLDQGFVTSESFVPDEYGPITFGSLAIPTQVLTLDNYYLTPNNDGTNDFLVIPEMEDSPNNSVQIFDRFGLKVFEMTNYTNEFNGFSNTGNVVMGKENGLPEGVYFYLINLIDLDMKFQGFLYLRR